MEAFKVLEQMSRLTGDLGQDPQMQKRLKEFWSMLEELSVNSPEEYQKFVEKQLKSGLEDIKKDEEASKTEVKLEVGCCVKVKTQRGGTIYVNICHSDKVLGPLKQDRSLADPLDLDSWITVPASFSLGTTGLEGEVFYDAAINSAAYIQMSRNERLRAQVCRNVLKRLEHKAKLGMLIDTEEVEYFGGDYRGAEEPQPHKLETAADPRDYYKYMQMIQNASQTGVLEKLQEPQPPKPVTIEEVRNYTELTTSGPKPEYAVFVERTQVKVEYRMPSGTTLTSIDFMTSNRILKLRSGSIALDLEFVFDLGPAVAKWLKKSSTLVVTLAKV